MQWYYVLNGTRSGPITQEQFDQLAQSGAITPDTLVWRSGMQTWLPLRDVLTQTASANGAPGALDSDSAICAVSGRVYPKRDMLEYNGQWISAEHKDEFFQRLREGTAQPGEMRYGGFWIRFAAQFIDGLCLLALIIIPMIFFMFASVHAIEPTYDPVTHRRIASGGNLGAYVLLQLAQFAVQTIITLAYDIFFIRKYDATPGKMACGLKVVRSNGDKLTVGRIIGRFFAKWVSQLILYIGYMMAGWDDQKRALHDHMCDTRVIKK